MANIHRWLQSSLLTSLCALALAPATVSADPVIEGITPDRGPLNSFATIIGSDFGDAQGRSFVRFGDYVVPAMGWTANSVTIWVNPLAYGATAPLALDTAYPVRVVKISGAADTKTSNSVNFTITSDPPAAYSTGGAGGSDQPLFESFHKPTYCNGDLIIFHGRYFGASQGRGSVAIRVPFRNAQGNLIFQDFALPVIEWYDTMVITRFFVPSGAELGSYTMTVRRDNGKTASANFIVTTCP